MYSREGGVTRLLVGLLTCEFNKSSSASPLAGASMGGRPRLQPGPRELLRSQLCRGPGGRAGGCFLA